MIRFVIVDDEIDEIKHIEKLISEVVTEDKEIISFTEVDALLKHEIQNVEMRKIYILDIELGNKMSGISLAKKIRDVDYESEIIFITNHDKMFETTYRNVYNVMDFIEKFHDMDHKLKKDMKLIFKKNFDNKMFKFSSRNLNLQIFYRSITHLYRDKESRKIIVNTDKTNYAVYLNVIDAVNYLDSRFKMVHRACIVNLDRVQVFNWTKGYFLLDTGEKVHMLSKKYKKEVEEYYERNN